MEISGQKTRAIFDRYDIIDEDDQRRTLERQQGYKLQQIEQGVGELGRPDRRGIEPQRRRGTQRSDFLGSEQKESLF